MKIKTAIERELYRRSFYQFTLKAFEVLNHSQTLEDNWHIQYLCDELQKETLRITEGLPKEKDLIICIPPRSLKSFIATVCLPVWSWVTNPSFKTISVSYSAQLSIEHNVLSRRLVESDWYQSLFGIQITSDQNVKFSFL